MAVAAQVSGYFAIGTAWTGTAPGTGTTPSGTLTATDISNWVVNANVAGVTATQNATTFGSGGFDTYVAGLKSGTLTLELLQDFAASATDALLGLNGSTRPFGSTSLLYLEIKPTSAARSATNPSFVCAVLNTKWDFLGAKVGDLPKVAWTPQITGAYAELTS